MAVLFKLHKIVRKFNDGREDPANNRWYARAFQIGTVTTNDLAEIIQRNCSMKKSDVQAVLTELVEVMQDKLQESYAVKLDGIGTFKIGISCVGADTVEEFSVAGNIKGSHINFTPAYTVDSATRVRSQALLKGCKYAETVVNKVERQK